MILIKSQRKMENAILGKALLDESRISENNPEFAQIMSNYFYHGICNSLYAMIKDSNPDFENSQHEDNAVQEIIMATRNFMREYIEIYEKYVYDN